MNDTAEQDIKTLREALRVELETPVADVLHKVSEDLAARHQNAVLGVIFYGSCLRDNVFEDRILDFYLVVETYHDALGSRISAIGNWLLPPNVYYAETTIDDVVYRSKYAIISLSQFVSHCRARSLSPYIWSRFSQPTRYITLAENPATERLTVATADAVLTMLSQTAPLCSDPGDAAEIWPQAYRQTYACEFRAESSDKGMELFGKNREFFEYVTPVGIRILAGRRLARLSTARAKWFVRRIQGKVQSVLRLMKGAFTFANGIDYILWKVERHSGYHIEPTEWQKRHPLMGGVVLTLRMWRQGGVS